MVNQLLIGLFLILPCRNKTVANKTGFRRVQQYNNQYAIVTFEEVIALAKQNQKN
jgi:hypothetical protein